MTTGFSWNAVNGGTLPVPEIGLLNLVTLNSLSAGTTYDFTITETNSYGKATHSGQFATAAAPSNEFVGWVSSIVSNPSELDQVGSTLPGASVNLTADCNVVVSASWTAGIIIQNLGTEAIAFPTVQTNSLGTYSLGFPESTSYIVWASGLVPMEDVVTQTLSASGTCSTSATNSGSLTNIWNGGTSISDSNYLLEAGLSGYWNATDWVSSALSASNDYQQFGLEQNGQDIAATAVAFVHTQYAGCQVTTATGMSQTIESLTGGNGFVYSNGNGQLETNEQPFGDDSSVAWHYNTTGVLNETNGVSVEYPANVYAVSGPYGPVLGMPFTDPYSSPPYTDAAHTLTVYPGGLIDGLGVKDGGSYKSISGLDMDVEVGAGWAGTSLGFSVPLVYTTSETTSSQNEVFCSFSDPSTTEPALFYFYEDGSQTPGAAINLHIWFDTVG
jgi:hypothetical protein